MPKQIATHTVPPATLHLPDHQLTEIQKIEEAVSLTHSAPSWHICIRRMEQWLQIRHVG